ncbi:MAG: hypothetical protein R2736_21295 [Solirubrobacterales bacterium]
MASADSKISVELDAQLVADARAEIGQSGDTDAATVERALKDYLVERLLDRVQASSDLSEEEANRIAYAELHAMRRERDNA